ncbi:MAG: PQ-loop domain-containing transporter [archaeon]|nr:PQ-loop domain-containing transporter [archaeon]
MSGLNSHGLQVFNDVLGWLYFLAWSLSFYPQVWDNWRRKSVVGFSLDYLDLNVLGYFSYSIYNCALYFNPFVQTEYLQSKGYPLPVNISDVVFSLHALLLTCVCVLQALVHDRGNQTVSFLSLCPFSCCSRLFCPFLFLFFPRSILYSYWPQQQRT